MHTQINAHLAAAIDRDRLQRAARRAQRPQRPERPPPRLRRQVASASARIAVKLDRDAAERAIA